MATLSNRSVRERAAWPSLTKDREITTRLHSNCITHHRLEHSDRRSQSEQGARSSNPSHVLLDCLLEVLKALAKHHLGSTGQGLAEQVLARKRRPRLHAQPVGALHIRHDSSMEIVHRQPATPAKVFGASRLHKVQAFHPVVLGLLTRTLHHCMEVRRHTLPLLRLVHGILRGSIVPRARVEHVFGDLEDSKLAFLGRRRSHDVLQNLAEKHRLGALVVSWIHLRHHSCSLEHLLTALEIHRFVLQPPLGTALPDGTEVRPSITIEARHRQSLRIRSSRKDDVHRKAPWLMEIGIPAALRALKGKVVRTHRLGSRHGARVGAGEALESLGGNRQGELGMRQHWSGGGGSWSWHAEGWWLSFKFVLIY